MKKVLLLLLLLVSISFTGCSADSESETNTNTPTQEYYMKVIGIGKGPKDGVGEMQYDISYGTSDKDQIVLIVSKDVWDFYQARIKEGNYRWIGEVTKE